MYVSVILIPFFLALSTCSSIACTHRNRINKWSEMERGRDSKREVLICAMTFKIADHRNRQMEAQERIFNRVMYPNLLQASPVQPI